MKSFFKLNSIRNRVLFFVSSLILLSVLFSAFSLLRIQRVNQTLDGINRVSIPLSKNLVQLQVDTEVLKREFNRNLGYINWNDVHWAPRPIPNWIYEVIEHELEKTEQLLNQEPLKSEAKFKDFLKWNQEIQSQFQKMKDMTKEVYVSLDAKKTQEANQLYPRWIEQIEAWTKNVHWGIVKFDQHQKEHFQEAQNQVAGLRTSLELILVLTVLLSFLLLWIAERALRPLHQMTQLAQSISERGIRREDKNTVQVYPLDQNNEVSQLSREFHKMATALLEREKIVEVQKNELEDHNLLLRELLKLNETVLNSFPSIVIVVDLSGKINRYNLKALEFLATEYEVMKSSNPKLPLDIKQYIQSSHLTHWSSLSLLLNLNGQNDVRKFNTHQKIEATKWVDHTYSGHFIPLDDDSLLLGAVLVLEDLTEDLRLQERLKQAEGLAMMGRLSAQVAHEIRNPLHSIGLESEMAIEQLKKMNLILRANSGKEISNSANVHHDTISNSQSILAMNTIEQSLLTIQDAVERLEKITQNYLKLSKLSSGKYEKRAASQLIESVIASYANTIAKNKITLDWNLSPNNDFEINVEVTLMEQALANLLQNAVQALASSQSLTDVDQSQTNSRKIMITLSRLESGNGLISIEDNGVGLSPEVLDKLFMPFVTTKAQGTGLGLSFVKKIIEDHLGEISYQRSRLGGARFDLVLPIHERTSESKFLDLDDTDKETNVTANITRAHIERREASINEGRL